MTSNVTYFSTTSIMETINASEQDVKNIDLYFIPSQCYKSQFNSYNAKIVALLITYKNDTKPRALKYDDMISYLKCVPIVTFKPSLNRRVIANQKLQKLTIRNNPKEFTGDNNEQHTYYDSNTTVILNEELIDKIVSAVPEHKHEIELDLFM